MKRNLTCLLDSIDLAGSFWRSSGPFTHLMKHMDLDLHLGTWAEKKVWTHLAAADIVFMHRPYSTQHLELFRQAKWNGAKIWLDYDDELFQIPTDNKTHDTYMTSANHNQIKYMLANADAVSVATEDMQKNWESKYCEKIHHLPNSYNPRIWGDKKRPEEKGDTGKIRVLWRGSEHHQKDLLTHADDIVEVAKAHPDVEFIFQGFKPWFIADSIENFIHVGPGPVDRYHEILYRLAPQIVMCPLFDNPFNHAKSNIAWVEASFAGAACVGPHWSEWQKPGVINYAPDRDGFKNCLMASIETAKTKPEILSTNVKTSWDYITTELNLDKINKKRAWIIKDLAPEGEMY